jgi:hypothetical protein
MREGTAEAGATGTNAMAMTATAAVAKQGGEGRRALRFTVTYGNGVKPAVVATDRGDVPDQ